MVRGQGDGPNRSSMNWYGDTKNGMSQRKSGSRGIEPRIDELVRGDEEWCVHPEKGVK